MVEDTVHGHPLICLWTQRGSPALVIEMLSDAGKHNLFRSATKHIRANSRIDTDSWRGYRWLGYLYDHRTVKHSECYVKDGVHCNTAEAEWSIFKPWWATFRGVAKRYIHRYLAHYEFQRNRRECSAIERLTELIALLYHFLFWLLFPSLQSPVLPLRAISYR